jgi:hypothetical protein
MAGTNNFSLGNLLSDVKFNFLNNIKSLNEDNIYDNHLSFLDTDNLDSPYNLNTFSCNYVDNDNLFDHLNPNDNLIIMSVNIQSLSAKFAELCEFINMCNRKNTMPDIILLQETWAIYDSDAFNINGYQPLCFKCRSKGQGGGGRGYLC